MNELTEEEEKYIKDNIEKFKIKIHWELDHYTDDHVLIFGNDRISSTTGDIRHVMFKLACMIDQIATQSGKNRKFILHGIKDMFKMVDVAKQMQD